jgi:hypothetical protein
MRVFIAIISALGFGLMSLAFVLSYISPGFVESVAQDVVRMEVERRVGEKLNALESNKIVALAERMSGRNATEINEIKKQLAVGLPQKVAAIVAEMQNPDCSCRKSIERSMASIFEGRMADLQRMNDRLSLMIRSKYMEVAESLTREFRIFTGANALVFALLGLTVWLRRQATVQLLLPALVLLGAAGLVAFFYIFRQDWLHTLVFAEYLGFGYFGYLGLAASFLADIAFNKARTCTALINAALNVVGATFQAVPC